MRPGDSIDYLAAANAPLGKDRPEVIHPGARYRMDRLRFQDIMAMETQGAIADRSIERAGSSDRGITLLREMLFREMDQVARGHDPLGVIRDPAQGPIDTRFENYLEVVLKYPRSGRAINPVVATESNSRG